MRPRDTDDLETLRTGMELARASQLTMLRLQLALHGSNRRIAMQAVDNLLDIDAELEGLAATLCTHPAHAASDAALAGYIGIQRAAIATEKHALTGSDPQRDSASVPMNTSGDWGNGVDDCVQRAFSDQDDGIRKRTGRTRWIAVFAAMVVLAIVGYGLTIYLPPASLLSTMSL